MLIELSTQTSLNQRHSGQLTEANSADNPVAVALGGEVDAVTAPAVLQALFAAVDDCTTARVVVDVSQVSFMGAAGLTALTEASRYAQLRSRTIVLFSPSKPVRDSLASARMDDAFVTVVEV